MLQQGRDEMTKKSKVSFMVTLAILIAIEVIIAFTPLGSIPLGPIVMTTAHIPVIVAVIVLGFKAGVVMGAVYGLLSFLVWTFIPPSPIAFLFTPFYSLGEVSGNLWSVLICFLPRLLIPVLTFFFIRVIYKISKNSFMGIFLGSFIGNLISSVFLLSLVYVFFGADYAKTIGVEYKALIGVIISTIFINAIPESIAGGLVGYGVGKFSNNYKK